MKFLLSCTVVLLLASNVELRRSKRVNVIEVFENEGIPADTNVTTPKTALQVSFNGSLATLGSELAPGDTLNLTIQSVTTPNSLYTLVIVDLDFPSREDPCLRAYIVGLYVNIPASLDLEEACEVAEYIPLSPPPATGEHRVVFYLFLQPEEIDATSQPITQYQLDRFGFSVAEFADENDLCDPIAAFFYLTRYFEPCDQ